MKEKEMVPVSFRTPFTMMRRLSEEMERVFEDVGFRGPLALITPTARSFDWLPALEVFERDNKLFVRAELPGLTKDDVKIEIAEGLLTIHGERKQEKEEKKAGIVRSERCYGTFFRQIALPEGASMDAAKATFKNGMLEIEMPVTAKKAEAVRRLKIEEAEKQLVGA
jgi:HSP20 family protein